MPPRNLNVTLVGKGPVVLRPNTYITTGGEASIYRLTDNIVKVFTDPTKMSKDRMVEKVQELAQFQHPYIIAPRGIVEDEKHKPIGYYMGFAEGEPLPRVFTTAFRQRDGFDDDDAIQLVHGMREVFLYGHAHGAILGDANELNWLMYRGTKPEPRVVDVDSWQIGTRWPLRVIMPSIRDWHTGGFNEASDWFSWGIVSFQVFTGIHPYKGRHDGYKQNELERRMKDNISVFDPRVHLNAAVRDFSAIPGPLLDWYQKTFQTIERTQPPSPLDKTHQTTIARQIRMVATSGSLVFEMILDNGQNPVVQVWPCGVALRASGSLIDLSTRRPLRTVTINGRALGSTAEVIQTERGYLIDDHGEFIYLDASNQTQLPLFIKHYGVVRSGNRMFVLTERGLTELNLLDMGKPILSLGQTWETLRLATEWFEGVGVQNSLGAKYLVLPFGDKSCGFIRTPELDAITVVTAKAGFRFISVIGLNKLGNYQKFEFCLDKEHAKYTVWIGDADNPELNLAVLPNGVCATVVEDNELVIFVPQNGNTQKITDKNIFTNMRLATWNDRVVYIRDGELWWVRVK
jgi:hypothetical protein